MAVKFSINVLIPNPHNKLKRGAATQPVKAISANPFFAIETFAIRSPIEFPQASTVRPNREAGKPVNIPKSYKRSIRKLAEIYIHKILITKEKKFSKINPRAGALDL